jgi:hypothetical protein
MKQFILPGFAPWIASRSLSSGAHSRDPVARNDRGGPPRAWQGTANSHSPNGRNPVTLLQTAILLPSLDFRGMDGIRRATFGKSEPQNA